MVTSATLTRQGRPIYGALEPLLSLSTQQDYGLDNGRLAVRHGKLPPNVLLVDSFPIRRYDPEKPIRAAAFAGWAMARPWSAADLDDTIQKIEVQLAEPSVGISERDEDNVDERDDLDE